MKIGIIGIALIAIFSQATFVECSAPKNASVPSGNRESYFSVVDKKYKWYDYVVTLGGFYYLSRYPKVLGSIELIDLFFDPHYQEGDLFRNTPPIIYNFFLTDSDVGDEGRLEVFAINATLMIGGHLIYSTFFKSNSIPDDRPKPLSLTPLLSPEYGGLMATYRF